MNIKQITKNNIWSLQSKIIHKGSIGFSLIELLVVLGIVSLLASLIIVAVNSARTKSRNANRNANALQLVKAFNLALANSGSGLPNTGNNWACVSSSCYGGWSTITASPTVDSFLAPYLLSKPTDPPDPNVRNEGGFIFSAAWVPTNGGNSWNNLGGTFSTGAYISYELETTDPTACAPARFWWMYTTYIQCMAPIN